LLLLASAGGFLARSIACESPELTALEVIDIGGLVGLRRCWWHGLGGFSGQGGGGWGGPGGGAEKEQAGRVSALGGRVCGRGRCCGVPVKVESLEVAEVGAEAGAPDHGIEC